ncbi:gp15 [Shigella virus Moo19]|uniref:Uncharacterized protein n=1 Tax=Shigella virus Moo19 TaxID=2886042 RepID=A0AAE9C671_9CAUD|nr:gp15 [Shigella virus Moo19]UEN68811.1 hypothetical protein Moo19_gp15 [Shigella virus Moo19]
MIEFKVGDIIEPIEGFPQWKGITILEWNPITRDASVKLKSGTVIHGFNLDPDYGVEFKCVSPS